MLKLNLHKYNKNEKNIKKITLCLHNSVFGKILENIMQREQPIIVIYKKVKILNYGLQNCYKKC